MAKITTTSNFEFIQDCFIESKLAAKEELETGIENPDRLKGCGLEGASRTGKSWDICAFICHYASSYEGKLITIGRDHLTTLKDTFYETLKKVWALYGWSTAQFNKSATNIEINGNTIRFVGINDDPDKALGYESDLLIINEVITCDYDTVEAMEQRCNEFYIFDYNPIEVECKVYDKELLPSYRLHRTNIFENEYAPANAKAKILGYAHPDCDDFHIAKKAGYTAEEWKALKERNVELKTADKYKWEVYGLGKRAVGEDAVFAAWETYSDEEEPDEGSLDWQHVGGDFGFTVDPTAGVKVKKQGNNLYLRELFYETGLLSKHIAAKMEELGENEELSIWDRAQEMTIMELRDLNVNAWYSEKGAGSVYFGIEKMKQFNIYIHEDSVNLLNEFAGYRWLKDKKGNYKRNTLGNLIPVDKDNHLIDAARYVLLFYFWEGVLENAA